MWHWEEVNYTRWVLCKVTDTLKEFHWSDVDNDAEVEFVRPVVQGDAAISLRRGHAVVACAMSIKAEWVGRCQTVTFSGTLGIPCFDLDVLRETPEVSLAVIGNDEGRRTHMKALLHASLIPQLIEVLRSRVLQPLTTVEADKALQDQKAKLQSAGGRSTHDDARSTEKRDATAPLSETHDAVCAAARHTPADFPKNASVLTLPQKDVSSPPPSGGPPTTPTPTFWSEKSLGVFAIEWLRQHLDKASQDGKIGCLEGKRCVLNFFGVQISGDASQSFRQGKRKVTLFDFTVKFNWRAVNRNEAGVFLADAKGTGEILNFTSEDLDELAVHFRCDDEQHAARKRIFTAVKDECGPQVLEILREFASKLAKVDDSFFQKRDTAEEHGPLS